MKYLRQKLLGVSVAFLLGFHVSCGSAPQQGAALHDIADASSTAWVARHGLTSAQYQSEVEALMKQGYRPTYVSGYAVNNEARFAAIFDQVPNSAPWMARHQLTSAQYAAEFQRLTGQGYRLAFVNGYTIGGQEYFVALWEQRSGPEWVARHNLSSSEYQAEMQKQVQAGFRLTHVSGYSVNGAERFAALWEKTGSSPWEARHGMDAATYQAEFNRYTQQGYRLVRVSPYAVNGQHRFAAIWEKRAGLPLVALHGLDDVSFQDSFNDLRYQGYRPAMISGYGSGSSPQYAGIWHNTLYSAKDLAYIDSVVEGVRSRQNHPALSLAITKDGKLVFAKAYGLADKESGTMARTRHRFRIASISKPITATAIMKLVEAGRISLDQKVFGPGSLLGDSWGSKRPYNKGILDITVRHLLQHTAGGWINDGLDPMFRHPEMNAQQLISWVLDNRPLDNTPGTVPAYSNFGYCILGRVIEKITGMSYENYVKQNVLASTPGMTIAGNTLQERRTDEVKYYDANPNAPYDMQVTRMDAHGGWLASPLELVRFGLSVDGSPSKPDQLSPASIKTMLTGTSVSPGYGLGWGIDANANQWHNGLLSGTTSVLLHNKDGFVWSAIASSRDDGVSIDAMMWQIMQGVSRWPTVDLF